jgi:hypothetical protein
LVACQTQNTFNSRFTAKPSIRSKPGTLHKRLSTTD